MSELGDYSRPLVAYPATDRYGAGVMVDTFRVSPGAATCSASSPRSGVSASVSRSGQWRTVTCPEGQAPSIDGTGMCVPTATVPADCPVTSLDADTSWWGRVINYRH